MKYYVLLLFMCLCMTVNAQSTHTINNGDTTFIITIVIGHIDTVPPAVHVDLYPPPKKHLYLARPRNQHSPAPEPRCDYDENGDIMGCWYYNRKRGRWEYISK